jgi:hypothetical protein
MQSGMLEHDRARYPRLGLVADEAGEAGKEGSAGPPEGSARRSAGDLCLGGRDESRGWQAEVHRPSSLWIDQALSTDTRIELIALSPRVTIGAAELEWTHGDPADRFIVATAQLYECQLATCDKTIIDSGLVRCVWD